MKKTIPTLALSIVLLPFLNGCITGMISKMMDSARVPPVAYAIYASDTTEVKRLLDSSADVINHPWFAGYHAPLAFTPNAAMTEWLIAHGADVNLKLEDGSTPLTEIASHETDQAEIIAVMVKHGARVNNANDKGYKSRSARIHDIEQSRSTAGMYGQPGNRTSASYSPSAVVRKGGVDVGEFMLIGKTPLHAAAEAGVANNVKALVANGATVDITDGDDKLTPLHVACIMVNTDAAEALIALGANINAKNDDDETPLKLLTKSESTRDKTQLTTYLKAHGATE